MGDIEERCCCRAESAEQGARAEEAECLLPIEDQGDGEQPRTTPPPAFQVEEQEATTESLLPAALMLDQAQVLIPDTSTSCAPTDTPSGSKQRCTKPYRAAAGSIALACIAALALVLRLRSQPPPIPLEWDDYPSGVGRQHGPLSSTKLDEGADDSDCGTATEPRPGCLPTVRSGDARRLVHECAKRLELHGEEQCTGGADAAPVEENTYRVPFMESAGVSCGFESLMNADVMDELASKYVFRFIGSSTTRRLAESFVSIYSGIASTHVVYHTRRDFSSGALRVIFDWAPLCAGEEGVGAAVATAMLEEQSENHGKRIAIVTAFGVHDACLIQEYQTQNLSVIAPGGNETSEYLMYEHARQRGALAMDECNLASTNSCRELSAQLERVATLGELPSAQPAWEGGRGLRATPTETFAVAVAAEAGGEKGSPARGYREDVVGNGRGPVAVGGPRSPRNERGFEAPASAFASAPPGVSLMKRAVEAAAAAVETEERTEPGGGALENPKSQAEIGNRAGGDARRRARRLGRWSGLGSGLKGGSEDAAADGSSEEAAGQDGGVDLPPLVFLFQSNPFAAGDPRDDWLSNLHHLQREEIDVRGDRRSDEGGVFIVDDRVSLYGSMSCYRVDEIHFFEPVKIVEGKMLWHLLTIADRGSAPPVASAGARGEGEAGGGRDGEIVGGGADAIDEKDQP